MPMLDGLLQRKLESLSLPLAVVLPDGHRVGPPDAAVTLRLAELAPLAHIAQGEIGKVADDYVQGRLDFDGTVRDLMHVAAEMLGEDPTQVDPTSSPVGWWREIRSAARSRARHKPETDAEQIQFHYDVSDDFYKLWLDPQRLYSCAYFREPAMTLEEAQQAKLDHICTKLMLKPGERFLDVGAGWGGLLLRAAEHYGVVAHGITLSRNQHAHVNRLIDERGLRGRVTMELLDYRDLLETPRAEPYDKIASVGMFEHVGRAQLPAYFAKLRRLLRPGGLLMNHGITAGGTRNHQLGAGIGEFIDRHIFPGGELQHVSRVVEVMAEAGLEPLDLENLRPHYGRTLWAWSDALEAQLDEARKVASDKVVRAYRLYLAGSAMGFERGWMALFQILGARPSGDVDAGPMRGAQSDYPFNRSYVYTAAPQMIYKFKSKASGDVIMMGPTGDEVLRTIGKSPAAQGIIEVDAMPGAIAAIEAAVAADEAARAQAENDAAAAGTRLAPRDGVSLRQRAWPLVEMMKRSAAAGADIVWGV